MNATMLTEELGIAIRPIVLPTKKVVRREEIETIVRKIMQYEEGKAMREMAKKLKMSAKNASSKGGSSCDAISRLLQDIEMKTATMSQV
ncbi:hypothetical protein RND71_034295 [Anisodus tanguticus]|uniref:Uncharacterized protein n=1 Tax=Anisodus tanguticus TaxID=243964 RepID=A0AAE1R9W0_9SOLA|nr:hypothetical protein RND71_034295 [Anisodus tanguticus]